MAAAAAVVLLVVGVTLLATRGGDSPGSTANGPVVGGDLHTVAVVGDALYVAGHAAVGVSRDGGRQWQQVDALKGADPMGWAVTSDTVLVGGHPGLFRSTDNGATFNKVTGAGTVPDAHALGGAGGTFYLGSPQAGLLASTDGGSTWHYRHLFVRDYNLDRGSLLRGIEYEHGLLVVASEDGILLSRDGGRHFTRALAGLPFSAVAISGPPPGRILAGGNGTSYLSVDGGETWVSIDVGTTTRGSRLVTI